MKKSLILGTVTVVCTVVVMLISGHVQGRNLSGLDVSVEEDEVQLEEVLSEMEEDIVFTVVIRAHRQGVPATGSLSTAVNGARLCAASAIDRLNCLTSCAAEGEESCVINSAERAYCAGFICCSGGQCCFTCACGGNCQNE
jgi:hypothetical protein